MPAECRSVLKACLAQFVLLDVCGNPVTGAASKLTTKGFIKVVATMEVETGVETIVKNACGEVVVDEKDDDEFKRYTTQYDFWQIDPEALTLLANNARALLDGDGNAKGFAAGRNIATAHFSLELWTKVAGQTCDASGNPEWYYFALPHNAGGLVTDFTFEDGPLTLTIKGNTLDAGENWGRGPSCVLPTESPAISTDHLLGYITSIQPPEPVCGLQAVSAADLACV
jgi:hypothetical protein